MVRLGWLGRWWWRWLLGWAILVGLGLIALFVLPLSGLLPTPQVLRTIPAAAARDVPPRSSLTWYFSTPMDQSSVQLALRVEPPLPGTWRWDNRTTAIWTPEPAWTAATSYTVTLESTARSLLRESLPAPFVVSFRTAPAPLVTFRSPPPAGILATGAPLLLRFDRPLVAPANVLSRTLPELSLSPPLSTTARWYDERTVMIEADFAAGTSYTATLNGLTDLLGTPVDLPPWSWTTASPNLLAFDPAPAARIVPTEPLSLAFSGVLDAATIQSITRTFTIQPPITATWQIARQTAPQPQTTLTLLPNAGWQTGASYTASLNLPGSPAQQWHWTVEPTLAVLGTVPGRNGQIAPTDEVRVIFNTPPTETALSERLTVEPAVDALALRVVGSQVRVSGAWTPSMAYTLTLADGRGDTFALPFRTAGSSTSLVISEPANPFSQWQPDQTPQITLQIVGSRRATATLYPLDRPLLTTLLLNPKTPFDPTRFNQAAVGAWSLVAPEAANQWQTTLALTGTDTGAALAGGYVLRVVADGGLVAQHVFVISPYLVQVVASNTAADVWVIDGRNGQPAANLPLVILRGGGQIAVGNSDAAGAWRTAIPASNGPLLVLGGPAEAPVVGTVQQTITPPEAAQVNAMLDRTHYHLGDEIRLAGSVVWPNAAPLSPTLELALVVADEQTRLALFSQRLNAPTFAMTLPIRAAYPFGAYALTIALDGTHITTLPLWIDPAPDPRLELRVAAVTTPGATLRGEVVLREADGTPRPNQAGQWLIRTADGRELSGGSFTSDAVGIGTFAMPLAADLAPQTLQIVAQHNGRETSAISQIAAARTLTLRSERTLVQPNELVPLLVTAVDGAGLPLQNTVVDVNIRGDAAPAQYRRRTDAAGMLAIQWRVPGSGRFDLVAESAGTTAPPLTIWATRPGFSGWLPASDGTLALALERSTIGVGESIRVLPLLPARLGTAHLSWNNGTLTASQTVEWSAGVPLSLTLPVSATGRVALAVALLTEENGRSVLHNGLVSVDVMSNDAVDLRLSSVAPLQITTRTADDQPVATPLQILVREANDPFDSPDGTRGTVALWLPNASTAANGSLLLSPDLPPSRNGWVVAVLAGSRRVVATIAPQPAPSIDWIVPTTLYAGDQGTAMVRLATNSDLAQTVSITISTQPAITLAITRQQVTLPPQEPILVPLALVAAKPGSTVITLTTTLGDTTSMWSQTVQVQPPAFTQRTIISQLVTATTVLSWTLPPAAETGVIELATAPSVADLRSAGEAALAQDSTLLGAAGRIALAQTTSITTTFARDLATLRGAQARDGGWSWDGGASDPLLTAQIVALLDQAATTPVLNSMLDRAAAWLQTQRATIRDPDTTALILAALARQNINVNPAITALLDSTTLHPASRVMLITALDQQGRASEAAAYFAQLPTTNPPWQAAHGAPWESSARTAALIGQMLLRDDADNPLLVAAGREIGRTWDGAGWQDVLATTEVLRFLNGLAGRERAAAYTVQHGTSTLYSGESAWRGMLPLEANPLTLTLQTTGELAFAARLQWRGGVAPAQALVTLATLDGDGAPFASPPRVGGVQQWRLTLAVLEPLPYATLDIAIPSGVVVEAVDTTALPFLAGQLNGRTALLPVGVYPLTIYGRATLAGTFAWPLPYLTTTSQPINVNGDVLALIVQP